MNAVDYPLSSHAGNITQQYGHLLSFCRKFEFLYRYRNRHCYFFETFLLEKKIKHKYYINLMPACAQYFCSAS